MNVTPERTASDPSRHDWHGIIRALIYPVQFERAPLDGVDRVIRIVVDNKNLMLSRDQYRNAIRAALASKEELSELIPQDHSEGAVRRYLRAVHSKISGV